MATEKDHQEQHSQAGSNAQTFHNSQQQQSTDRIMKNKTNGPTDEQLLADIERLNDAAIEADVERRINEQTDRIVNAITQGFNKLAQATLIAATMRNNNEHVLNGDPLTQHQMEKDMEKAIEAACEVFKEAPLNMVGTDIGG